VRKWCRLFKEGTIRRDRAPSSVDAHESKSSSGKISSVLHTSPTLRRVSFACFFPQEIFVRPESEERPRDKRRCAELAESLDGEYFFSMKALKS
jgi:hypothetical protein